MPKHYLIDSVSETFTKPQILSNSGALESVAQHSSGSLWLLPMDVCFSILLVSQSIKNNPSCY